MEHKFYSWSEVYKTVDVDVVGISSMICGKTNSWVSCRSREGKKTTVLHQMGSTAGNQVNADCDIAVTAVGGSHTVGYSEFSLCRLVPVFRHSMQ